MSMLGKRCLAAEMHGLGTQLTVCWDLVSSHYRMPVPLAKPPAHVPTARTPARQSSVCL